MIFKLIKIPKAGIISFLIEIGKYSIQIAFVNKLKLPND